DLSVTADGLVTGKSHSLTSVTEAWISDVDPGAEALLAAVAPPGSDVTLVAGGLRARVEEPRLLLPWLAAYATGAARGGGHPGTFLFRTAEHRTEASHVPGATFVGRVPATLSHVDLAEGI